MGVSLRKLHQDNSGVIMITVLVLVLVMTVVAIGILGINISQVSTSQSVADTIRCEQLAIGAFYQYHQQQVEGCAPACTPPDDWKEDIEDKTYSITVESKGDAGELLNNVNQIDVSCNY